MNRKLIVNTGCVLGALLGIGLVQYYLFRQKKPSETILPKQKPLQTTHKDALIEEKLVTPQFSSSENKKKPMPPKGFPLKLGSKGAYVTELQLYLLKNHGWEDVKMGEFDQLTQKRVKRFLKVTEIDSTLYKKVTGKVIK